MSTFVNNATLSEVVKNGNEIAVVNEELSKYKNVFKKIMTDLRQASHGTAAEDHHELDTADPMEIYENFMKDCATTGKLDLTSQKIKDIQCIAPIAHSGITVLENRLSEIDYNQQNLAFSLNNTDQYSKSWNIIIRGLKNLPVMSNATKFDDFEFEFIDFICNELNKHLGGHLHSPLQPHDIERAHLLYQRSKTAKPAVIVRFVRRVIRNNVFFKRRHLKGTDISISDHLTRLNKAIFDEAKSIFGSDNTWTSLSKIFVSVNGRRYEMKSLADVESLHSYHSSQDLASHTLPEATVVTAAIGPDIEGKNPEQSLPNVKDTSNIVVDEPSIAKSVGIKERNNTSAKGTRHPFRNTRSVNRYSGNNTKYIKQDLRYNR